MAKYLDKWKTDFPASVGNVTRPTDGIDNTLDFNSDGFPQRISSDPVHYKLENDMASQLFSNDARLKETIEANKKAEDDALANHNKSAQSHVNGIAGNAASATKLKTARTVTVDLGSATGASFDGTANINPGVSGTLPVTKGGTGATSLDDVTVGAAKTLTGNDGFFRYIHRFGENLESANDLSDNFKRKIFMSSYSKIMFPNQPDSYGTLINIPYGLANEVVQFWITQPSGALWYRGSNGNTALSETPFKQLVNTEALGAKVDKIAGKGLSTNDYTTDEKTKLAGIAAKANNYSLPTASSSVLGGVKVGTNLSISNGVLSALAASQSVAGYMSAADKKKLDGIASGANAYSLPTASASTLGGVKVGSGLNILNGILSANAQSLGVVAGDVSNANAWWVKLGGTIPLIIQGGYSKVKATVTFPIAFSNAALSVMATLSRGDEEAAQTWEYTANNFYLYQRCSDRYAHWLAVGF